MVLGKVSVRTLWWGVTNKVGLKIKKQSAALHEQPIDLFYEYRLEFDILAGGDAPIDRDASPCAPGRLMVRPGDRTSFIAGGDACAPDIRNPNPAEQRVCPSRA